MRVDVVTIFPEYFSVLDVSLTGKARTAGVIDVAVHDLREWTHDRHRTVDDTPYGGGAGMVMRPEPWGEALDVLAADGNAVLVVPTPAGVPLTQRVAEDLAGADRLVVACGRYEGIDQRVVDHAAQRMRVVELSVGDVVLNGGEVAALVLLEAVTRLLPGFMGNPDSLREESHGPAGLLEGPVYTKPTSWRGLEVPEVLLSGDHERIAAWRARQALRRTADRRPDLLHPARAVTVGGLDADLRLATRADAGELWTLTRACWLQEGQLNDAWDIPPLVESYYDAVAGIAEHLTLVLRAGGRLIGSVRGRLGGSGSDAHARADADQWMVGRLMVAPDLQGRGLGRRLLEEIEAAAPPEATSYVLVTGERSEANLRRYRRAGYRRASEQDDPRIVRLVKRRRTPRGA